MLGMCVLVWGLGLCGLYIFTGWDLYDLDELHMVRAEDQVINLNKSSSTISWWATLYARKAIN